MPRVLIVFLALFIAVGGLAVVLKRGTGDAREELVSAVHDIASGEALAKTPSEAQGAPFTTRPLATFAPSDDYPFYMPMDGLNEPEDVRHISCELSNKNGEITETNGDVFRQKNMAGFEGIEFVFEPCVYEMAPPTIRNYWWKDGSQVIYRTTARGQKAVFRTDDQWASLRVKPGNVYRFHVELTDIVLDFPGATQASGGLWFEVTTDPGELATLVIRDSVLTGGKNALFAPSSMTMVYVENSEIRDNAGKHYDQHHAVYLNGVLSAHFNNVRIGGQRSKGSNGGHQLKSKARINILEDVTLYNRNDRKGQAASGRPLADLSTFGWTWSDGLRLERVETGHKMRPTMIDMRQDRYGLSAVDVPFDSAEGADMGVAPPGCSAVPDRPDQIYWHVFRDTEVVSEVPEREVFRMSGLWATRFDGIHPDTPAKEARANPRRNRAMLLTFDTEHRAGRVGHDGYVYNQAPIPTYHCENAKLGPRMSELLSSRETFLRHAFNSLDAANGDEIPLPWER